MDQHWSAPGWLVIVVLAVVVLVILALATAALRARRRAALAVSRGRDEVSALREEIRAVQDRLADPSAAAAPTRPTQPTQPTRGVPDYVITRLGEPDDPGGPEGAEQVDRAPALPASVFADLVLRETAVQAAALAHGVRRALNTEGRNRIRSVYRSEVKRSRRQRRLDLREARREWEARRRAAA